MKIKTHVGNNLKVLNTGLVGFVLPLNGSLQGDGEPAGERLHSLFK